MPILQRLIAIVSGALFLQLSLLGSVAPCSMDGGRGHTAMAGGHVMDGGHSDTICDARNAGKSCRLPCVPDSQGACASMASCSIVTASPPSEARLLSARTAAAVLPEPVSAESELAIAPELPPPRV
jgi:hypothetical protein